MRVFVLLTAIFYPVEAFSQLERATGTQKKSLLRGFFSPTNGEIFYEKKLRKKSDAYPQKFCTNSPKHAIKSSEYGYPTWTHFSKRITSPLAKQQHRPDTTRTILRASVGPEKFLERKLEERGC